MSVFHLSDGYLHYDRVDLEVEADTDLYFSDETVRFKVHSIHTTPHSLLAWFDIFLSSPFRLESHQLSLLLRYS